MSPGGSRDADNGAPAAAGAPLLEVIALTPADARAAELGGAHRLEIVSRIDIGGLTPALEQFASIRAAVAIPLRVMLRTNAGFGITAPELHDLLQTASALRSIGADQFVFGLLDPDGALDEAALKQAYDAIAPCPWTLHHAFDHAQDMKSAWRVASALPGLDAVLSGGVRGDLAQGLDALRSRASWQASGPRWLAGGGLTLALVEPLMAAGIRQFHIGRAARLNHSWSEPVSAAAVRRWRETLDAVPNG